MSASKAKAARLDEAMRRKPTWRAGRKVRLLDGQVWSFAVPVVKAIIVPTPDGPRAMPAYRFLLANKADNAALNATYRGLIDGYASAGTAIDRLSALGQIGVFLLRFSYEITAKAALDLILRPGADLAVLAELIEEVTASCVLAPTVEYWAMYLAIRDARIAIRRTAATKQRKGA